MIQRAGFFPPEASTSPRTRTAVGGPRAAGIDGDGDIDVLTAFY